jgi:hypothetical protein
MSRYSRIELVRTRGEVADDLFPVLKKEKLVNLSDFLPPVREGALGVSVFKRSPSSSVVVPLERSQVFMPDDLLVGGNFSVISSDTWLYRNIEPKGRFWRVIMKGAVPTAGRSYIATARIKADAEVTVDVSVARHGSEPYEGGNKKIVLKPGKEELVSVQANFAKNFSTLKFQVEVVGLKGVDEAAISVSDFSFLESVSSVEKRSGKSIGAATIADANRSFRERDYYSAMALYYCLEQKLRDLSIYQFNLKLCLKKIGFSSRVLDSLGSRIGCV